MRRRADFSAREASPNPPLSGKALTKDRFEIADPKNLRGEEGSGRAASEGGFQIENLIERLEKSMIEAENVKTQHYERSQEVVENKGKSFFHTLQSQEVLEKKGVIFVKPRDY